MLAAGVLQMLCVVPCCGFKADPLKLEFRDRVSIVREARLRGGSGGGAAAGGERRRRAAAARASSR